MNGEKHNGTVSPGTPPRDEGRKAQRDDDDKHDDDESGGTLRTLVFVAIFIAGLALVARVIKPPKHALEGQAAPDFSLTVLDTQSKPTAFPEDRPSKKLALADLRGKPVLLDFWATWCGPCKAQSPILDGVQKRLGDRGLTVVGIATNDVPSAARQWARNHGISYPIVMDEDGTLSRTYGVANLPTLVVVGKDGSVKAVRVGLTDASELERLVQKEL